MKSETIGMSQLQRCENALKSVQEAFTSVFGLGRGVEAQNQLTPAIAVELVKDKHSDKCLKVDGWVFLTPTVKSPLIKRKMLNGEFRPDFPAWEVTTGIWERSNHRDEPDNFDVVEIESDGSFAGALSVAIKLVAERLLNTHWEEQRDRRTN